MLKLGVVIGRFQPVHKYHIDNLIVPALEASDKLLILVGSANKALNIRNPFTFQERKTMIYLALCDVFKPPLGATFPKIEIQSLRDYPYSDEEWMVQVQKKIQDHIKILGENVEVTLYGSNKDYSTRYLNWFPQWKSVVLDAKKIKDFKGAVTIRNELFGGRELEQMYQHLYSSVYHWLREYVLNNPQFTVLEEEYKFIQLYKEQFKSLKYPPIFHTVDNVVVYKGNILLVKRKAHPGKGLWALPGGFLHDDETLLDGALRELDEETTLRLAKQVASTPWGGKIIEGGKLTKVNLVASKTFDHPERSLRGRTITTAFLFKIPDSWQVEIKAADDAADARWFTISEVVNDLGNQLFEDHQDIIMSMIKEL